MGALRPNGSAVPRWQRLISRTTTTRSASSEFAAGRGARRAWSTSLPAAGLLWTDWLDERGDDAGPLLCPLNRGGTITLRRISDHVVFVVCRKRAEQAGIQPFSPHDMRRTFIGDLLDAGADISVAQ